jgi:hypothetical protein
MPLGKLEPLGGLQLVLRPGQLSLAPGLKLTTRVQVPGAVLVVMLPGQVMSGGSVSLTVTVKLQLAVLSDASVAVQITGVVPLAKVEPLGGLQLVLTPGQLSLALAV